jgi:hypothetical protein
LKHTPDAAKQIDGAPDAPAKGPVQVTVYDPNNTAVPEVGVPVVFIEADGTVVGRPVTDTAGIATSEVHANATVTGVIPGTNGNETVMMTVTDVQPGDHIILGNSITSTSGSSTFTVSFPAYSGATGYYVVGPCSYTSTTALSIALNIYDYCKQSTMDILIIPYNAQALPIAYLEKPNVAYTPGGSTSVSGTYLLPGTFTAQYTNIDASITALNYTRYTPALEGYGTGASGTPANGMLTLSGQAFNAQSSTVQTRVSRGNNIQIVVQNMAGNATSYSMDGAATLLPWVGPVTPDFANHKLAVTVDTTGTSNDPLDLSYMMFNYSRTNGSAGTLPFRWYVLGHAAGDVTLPQLPIEVGDVMPQTTDTMGQVFVVLLESSSLTWDMVRAAPFDVISGLQTVPDTTTRLRESAYQPRGT